MSQSTGEHDFDDTPLTTYIPGYQSGGLGINQELHVMSRIASSLKYCAAQQPITVREYFRDFPRHKAERIAGIIKAGTVIVVAVGGSILYLVGSVVLAEEQGDGLGWEILTTASSFGTKIMWGGYFTADTLYNLLNQEERTFTGYDGRACRLFGPLVACAVFALLPATSYLASFLVTTELARWRLGFFGAGAILTFLSYEFTSIFAIRNKVGSLYQSVHSTIGSTRVKAQYQLQGRYLEIIDGAQWAIARKARMARLNGETAFPPELANLHYNSNASTNEFIAALISFARSNGVIDRIAQRPRKSIIIDWTSSIIALIPTAIVEMHLTGSFWAVEAAFRAIGHSVSWLSGLAQPAVVYPLSAVIDAILAILVGGLTYTGTKAVTQFTLTAITSRCRLEEMSIDWLFLTHPKLFIAGMAIGMGFGAFSFPLGVKLVTMIPDDYKILGFILINPEFREFCKYCAYIGIPIVSSIAGVLATIWAFKGIAVRQGSENEKAYAILLKALDRHKMHMHTCVREVFANELTLLEGVMSVLEESEREPLSVAAAIGTGMNYQALIRSATIRDQDPERDALVQRGNINSAPEESASNHRFCAIM